MKCLKKYSWVKVPRGEIPFHGKGILIYYMRLASRAAFRKGTARYCGYTNAVEVGSWVGSVVGLKSILEVKKRRDALEIKVWDTSNRAINVVINNLKGIFFDDDDFEHMSCRVEASWGKMGMTEVRICDHEDLKKCEISH